MGSTEVDDSDGERVIVPATPIKPRAPAGAAGWSGRRLRQRTSLKQLNPYAFYQQEHERQFKSIGLKPLSYGFRPHDVGSAADPAFVAPIERPIAVERHAPVERRDAVRSVPSPRDAPSSERSAREAHERQARQRARPHPEDVFEFEADHWRDDPADNTGQSKVPAASVSSDDDRSEGESRSTPDTVADEETALLANLKKATHGVLPPSLITREFLRHQARKKLPKTTTMHEEEARPGMARVKRRRTGPAVVTISSDDEGDTDVDQHIAPPMPIQIDDGGEIVEDNRAAIDRMLPRDRGSVHERRQATKRVGKTRGPRLTEVLRAREQYEPSLASRDLRLAARTACRNGDRRPNGQRKLISLPRHRSIRSDRSDGDEPAVVLERWRSGKTPLPKLPRRERSSAHRSDAVDPLHRVMPRIAPRKADARESRQQSDLRGKALSRTSSVRSDASDRRRDRTIEQIAKLGEQRRTWQPRLYTTDVQHETLRRPPRTHRQPLRPVQLRLNAAEPTAIEKVSSWQRTTMPVVAPAAPVAPRGRAKPVARRLVRALSTFDASAASVSFGFVRLNLPSPPEMTRSITAFDVERCTSIETTINHCSQLDVGDWRGIVDRMLSHVPSLEWRDPLLAAFATHFAAPLDHLLLEQVLRRALPIMLKARPSLAWAIFLRALPDLTSLNACIPQGEPGWRAMLRIATLDARPNWDAVLQRLPEMLGEDTARRLAVRRLHFLVSECRWSGGEVLFGRGWADGALYQLFYQQLKLGDLTGESSEVGIPHDGDKFSEVDPSSTFQVMLKVLTCALKSAPPKIGQRLVDKLRTIGPLSFRSTMAVDTADLAKVRNRFSLELCTYSVGAQWKPRGLQEVAESAAANLADSHLVLRETSLRACIESIRLYRVRADRLQPLMRWYAAILQSTLSQYGVLLRELHENRHDARLHAALRANLSGERALLVECIVQLSSVSNVERVAELSDLLTPDYSEILENHFRFESPDLLIESCRLLRGLCHLADRLLPKESQDLYDEFAPSQDEHGDAVVDLDAEVTRQIDSVHRSLFRCLSNVCTGAEITNGLRRVALAVIDALVAAQACLSRRQPSFSWSGCMTGGECAWSRLLDKPITREVTAYYLARVLEAAPLSKEELAGPCYETWFARICLIDAGLLELARALLAPDLRSTVELADRRVELTMRALKSEEARARIGTLCTALDRARENLHDEALVRHLRLCNELAASIRLALPELATKHAGTWLFQLDGDIDLGRQAGLLWRSDDGSLDSFLDYFDRHGLTFATTALGPDTRAYTTYTAWDGRTSAARLRVIPAAADPALSSALLHVFLDVQESLWHGRSEVQLFAHECRSALALLRHTQSPLVDFLRRHGHAHDHPDDYERDERLSATVLL